MELRRFYVNQSAVNGGYITIDGEEYNHIVKVLRFKKGYIFIACDGTGNEYFCKITELLPERLIAEITDIKRTETEASVDISLYIGAIKAEKLGIAVQKAVELGVNRIAVFASRNTSEKNINFERLKLIAKEASKQCGRAFVPEISDKIAAFQEIISNKSETLVMAYEKENVLSLRELSNKLVKEKSIGIIIGSEGGFINDEAEAAIAAGVKTFSLGRRILRAETAAIISIGYLLQELDTIL